MKINVSYLYLFFNILYEYKTCAILYLSGCFMNRQLFEYSYELKKQNKRRVISLIAYLILVYFILNVIFDFLIFPVRQNSNSMIPDFSEGSISFITKIYPSPKRGDVVLLKSRNATEHNFFEKVWHNVSSFFTAQQYDSYVDSNYPGTNLQLRRIVGMPGDEIYMKDYVLYIKPANEKHFLTEFELSEKPYNLTFLTPPSQWNGSVGVKGSFDPIIIGNDEYFVLGDNRISISDSRLWGSVSKQEISGRVILRYFPIKSLKLY